MDNIKILDIGCGGGLLSEPMCRLGAKVSGIDASEKNINIARLHAKKNNLKIDYVCASPENFKTESKFDVILNPENPLEPLGIIYPMMIIQGRK